MISKNKTLRMIGVARECECLAKEAGLTEKEQTACFVMGFLHDIGYERTVRDNASDHPHIGVEMITAFIETNDAIEAIRNHGHKYENLNIYDRILNRADLTTDYAGQLVSVEERLNSIAFAYGKPHRYYKTAAKQAKAVFDNI